MKTFTTLFMSLFMVALLAQTSVRPNELVAEYRAARHEFSTTAPLILDQESHEKVTELKSDETEFSVYQLNTTELARIVDQAPAALQFYIPQPNKTALVLDLVRVNIFTPDFAVIDSRTGRPAQVETGVHYRGVTAGDDASLVAMSFFRNEMMGFVSHQNQNFVLGRLQGDAFRNGEHILYEDSAIFESEVFECGTPDDGYVYTEADLAPNDGSSRALSDCVRLYYEVDEDITQNKGGLAGATNYTTGIHNQVATIFSGEQIQTVISEIFVWVDDSPYVDGSSGSLLNQFQAQHGVFNGDLASLFSFKASGGVAAGFNGICNSNPDASMCFSSIGSSFAEVPSYSWTVDVATHELGHIFGSRHTHACVWNGNGTAIDGCAGFTEGNCTIPGNPPGGGTIMSYCHIVGVGKNLALGFGPQPGNVIRNVITNANCLSACGPPTCDDGFQNGDETGVDCGGPDCPDCPTCDDGFQNGDEEGVDCGGPDCPLCPCDGVAMRLTIVLDNYPGETTWAVVDGSGDVVAQGGSYGGFATGSTVIEDFCLADGCYTFTINDSFGDGICCGFGFGSYELIDQDNLVIVSGGEFGTSESTDFCVESDNGDAGGECEFTFDSEDFESTLGIWNDGGSDCQRYFNSAVANSGNYTVRLRDNTSSSKVTSDLINMSGTTGGFSVSFSYMAESMEPGEDFFLEYSTNGGLNFTEAGHWISGTDFENGVRYDELVIIDVTPTPVVVIRFVCDASTNSDYVYLDDIKVGDCDGSVTPPTCDDGIQNGDEEGVDCGGSSCPACPSCNDGVQNGDEEGVDCGGPDCVPCDSEVTCDDGVQNGDEEGVDCGGSFCPECTSCDDGVQNGDEEGVDCGGSDCPACPTCDDGIQNGDEEGIDCGGSDCMPCATGCTDKVIDTEDFETSLGIWNDNGSDCARTFDPNFATSGSYTVRLRDNTSSSRTTTNAFDASIYSALTVNFNFIAISMEPGEDFFLEYSTDGGGSFSQAGHWVSGQDFQNNAGQSESVTFFGSFTDNTVVRFRCDASTNSDYVYFDDININACTGGAMIEGNQSSNHELDEDIRNVSIFPIPASDFIRVNFDLLKPSDVQYIITDMTGKVISDQRLGVLEGRQNFTPDISTLESGVYLLVLQTNGTKTVKRFVVTN